MPENMPDVLISEEQIHAKVEELARHISVDYRDVDDLILVGVLKGSFIFLADLARHLTVPRSVDFMEELPRHPTGKLYKRLLRDKYWEGHNTRIL